MRSTPTAKRHACGFTLLEILVAVTLTTLLTALVMKVFLDANRNQQATQAVVTSHEAARVLTEVLSQDLSNTTLATITTGNVAKPTGVTFGGILSTSTGNITYRVTPDGALTRTDQAGITRSIARNVESILFTTEPAQRLIHVAIGMTDSPYAFRLTRYVRNQ